MKEVFLIGCYIKNEIQLSYLSELISKLKSENKDYIIVSHSHIPEFLVKDSIAYIYDSDNHLISNIDLGIITRFWYISEYFRIGSTSLSYGSINNYSVAAQNLLNRGLLISKSFGYDITHWIEYDYDIDISLTNDNVEIIKNNSEVGLVGWWCVNISYHSKDTIFDHLFGSLITINNKLIDNNTIMLSKSEIIDNLKSVNFACELYTEKFVTTGLIHKKQMNDSIKNRYSSQKSSDYQFAIYDRGNTLSLFILNVSDNPINLTIDFDGNLKDFTLPFHNYWEMFDIGYPKKLGFISNNSSNYLDLSDSKVYDYYVRNTILEDI